MQFFYTFFDTILYFFNNTLFGHLLGMVCGFLVFCTAMVVIRNFAKR